jgi:hypothetical protein
MSNRGHVRLFGSEAPPPPFEKHHMSSNFAEQFTELLKALRQPSGNNKPSSFERVGFLVLKSFRDQLLPSIDLIAKEIENKFNIKSTNQTDFRENPGSIYLEYAISTEESTEQLELILTGNPRIRVSGEILRVFTRIPDTYRVSVTGFSSSDLEREDIIRKMFDLFEPKEKAKYVFIPKFKTENGFVAIRGNVIAFYRHRPLVLDYEKFLTDNGFNLRDQFKSKEEAMKWKHSHAHREDSPQFVQKTDLEKETSVSTLPHSTSSSGKTFQSIIARDETLNNETPKTEKHDHCTRLQNQKNTKKGSTPGEPPPGDLKKKKQEAFFSKKK